MNPEKHNNISVFNLLFNIIIRFLYKRTRPGIITLNYAEKLRNGHFRKSLYYTYDLSKLD